jgi:hypothetical protein
VPREAPFLHPSQQRPLRPTFVLWGGYLGGAETFTIELAAAMQSLGAEPAVVFVLRSGALAERLSALNIDHAALGLARGRAVLRSPRQLARIVSKRDPDVAILIEYGYLAAALWSGGFRAPIIGIEHGSVLQMHRLRPLKQLLRRVDRLSGARACAAVVAVSE